MKWAKEAIPPMYAKGFIYVGCMDGSLYAVDIRCYKMES